MGAFSNDVTRDYSPHLQSWSSAKPSSASSMCWPQPVQVTLPQVEQLIGEHMVHPFGLEFLPLVYP